MTIVFVLWPDSIRSAELTGATRVMGDRKQLQAVVSRRPHASWVDAVLVFHHRDAAVTARRAAEERIAGEAQRGRAIGLLTAMIELSAVAHPGRAA